MQMRNFRKGKKKNYLGKEQLRIVKKIKMLLEIGAIVCVCLVGCGSNASMEEGTGSSSQKQETAGSKNDGKEKDKEKKPTPAPVLKIGTEGLKYILNADKESYSVASIGSATEVEIVIASEYEGLPVTGIMNEAFSGCKEIISVVIPSSVMQIEASAFKNCSKLYTIEIPESVIYIGEDAFRSCVNLQAVVLPEKLEYLGRGAFYRCESLTSITIPTKVTKIQNQTFFDCIKLEEVIFAEESSCTSIGDAAFKACAALIQIEFPKSMVIIGPEAFSQCDSLEMAKMQEGIGMIEAEAFESCKKLKEVKLPSSVTMLGTSSFYGCELITEMIIPAGVTEVPESLCENCYALTKVDIPATVNKIGKKAFKNCSLLREFIIPDAVKSLGDVGYGALNGCNNIEHISLPVIDERDAIYNLFGIELNTIVDFGEKEEITETLKTITITNADYIYSYAFQHLSYLEKVVIKSAIEEIQTAAFSYCKALEEIIFEDTSKLNKIEMNAFRSCAFTAFDVPEGVTEVGPGVFDGCRKLVSVTFPSTLTYIETGIWDDMDSLVSIEFKNTSGWVDAIWDKAYDVSDPAVNAEHFCELNERLVKK